jgi:hypothetical protein
VGAATAFLVGTGVNRMMQLARLKSAQLINATNSTASKIDKYGKRHYLVCAILYQDPGKRLSG